jgi:Domain of unknown function (DUF1707)
MPRTIDGMSDTPNRIRASDVERERVAKRLQSASAEGRLTLEETEQRLGAVYAAKYLDDLGKLVADLPPEQRAPGRYPSPLLIHAGVVAVLTVMIIAHWIVSGAVFFWPVVPLFWLGVSLAVHAAFRAYRRPVPY